MLGCLGYEGYVTFTDLAVKPIYGKSHEMTYRCARTVYFEIALCPYYTVLCIVLQPLPQGLHVFHYGGVIVIWASSRRFWASPFPKP